MTREIQAGSRTSDNAQLEAVTLLQYLLKSGWKIIMRPVTYRVVGFLKRAERDTNFTPLSLQCLSAEGLN